MTRRFFPAGPRKAGAFAVSLTGEKMASNKGEELCFRCPMRSRKGLPYMKSTHNFAPIKWTNSIGFADREGRGSKNTKNLVDVIYGSPQRVRAAMISL